MSKSIFVLTGSPRAGGNTDMLADAFCEGARKSGNQIVRIDAGREGIGGCVGCGGCFSTGSPCVAHDNFDKVANALMSCDSIAIITPIYWFTFPTGLKGAIDRMYCFYHSGTEMKVKNSFLTVVGGAPDVDWYDPMVKTYQNIAMAAGWQDLGHIVVPGCNDYGSVAQTPALDGMKRIGEAF